MTSFWDKLPQPFFVLAPMEAVTDVVFRHVVAAAAPPDVFFTEFTNATGWAHAGDKAIGGRLLKTNDESPIVAQLWGNDPVAMEKLSKHCVTLGYDGIDINMGCPDMSAVKSGGGSGMIKNPENAARIIAAAKKSGLPISVKTRLGYSRVDEWPEWLAHILRQDIVNLTIHLRTKKEMSKVPAHFELISDIKKLRDEIAPHTRLTINGDIMDRMQGMELVEQYGVDGIMIGRGIFKNPYAFAKTSGHPSAEGYQQREIVEAQEPSAEPFLSESVDDNRTELIRLLYLHLDLHDAYDKITPRKFDPLKRFFKVYMHSFPNAAELRDRLMQTHDTAEVRAVLRDFLESKPAEIH